MVRPGFQVSLARRLPAGLAELGIDVPEGIKLEVHDNTGGTHHVIVCTKCSCWPTFLSPMPPFWNNAEYTTRIVADPKLALIDIGLTLDPSEPVEVVDTTPEVRAMVIPKLPAVNGDPANAALAPYVNNLNITGYAR